jgi:hypothetical protein
MVKALFLTEAITVKHLSRNLLLVLRDQDDSNSRFWNIKTDRPVAKFVDICHRCHSDRLDF